MEAADSKAESVDDITAAAIAPMPTMEIYGGVRCWRAMGRMWPASPRSYGDGEPYMVIFQSDTRNVKIWHKSTWSHFSFLFILALCSTCWCSNCSNQQRWDSQYEDNGSCNEAGDPGCGWWGGWQGPLVEFLTSQVTKTLIKSKQNPLWLYILAMTQNNKAFNSCHILFTVCDGLDQY